MSCVSDVIWHPASIGFGLYPLDCDDPDDDSTCTNVITLSNVIGWIPVIGAIIGALHIVAGNKLMNDPDKGANSSLTCKEQKECGKGLIARGVCEILCLGPLLAIIDIIIAIARLCIEPPKNK